MPQNSRQRRPESKGTKLRLVSGTAGTQENGMVRNLKKAKISGFGFCKLDRQPTNFSVGKEGEGRSETGQPTFTT